MKEATPRGLRSLARGPFLDVVQPFERIVFKVPFGIELQPNKIWDYRNLLLGHQLSRLWEFVFREICNQHAAIDCEEQSSVALALLELTPFERLAGRMFSEESERYFSCRVKDAVFIKMGAELDEQCIPLAENLGTKGNEILMHLARKGQAAPGWREALADKSDYKFLPEKAGTRQEAVTLKQFGSLSRHAKRAFYRAKDAYCEALETVYEQRSPASIRVNPFASKL